MDFYGFFGSRWEGSVLRYILRTQTHLKGTIYVYELEQYDILCQKLSYIHKFHNSWLKETNSFQVRYQIFGYQLSSIVQIKEFLTYLFHVSIADRNTWKIPNPDSEGIDHP